MKLYPTKYSAMLMRLAISKIALDFLAWLIAGYFRLVYATSRFEGMNGDLALIDFKNDKPVIITFWHGRMAMIPFARPSQRDVHVLISRHTDGELISRVIARFGISAVRGSTERKDRAPNKGGAQAMRAMTKLLREGAAVGITPDGPRGPRMRISIGTIQLARLSGAPLFPVAFATSRRRILGSWDCFYLPLPFSKGVFQFGELIHVPRQGDTNIFEEKRLELEDVMNRLTFEADQYFGHEPILPATDMTDRS